MSKTQLYRWFDKDDNLLYVGISYSAMVRASQHKAKSNEGWYDLAVKCTTENFETRDAAVKAESKAIKLEHPKYNLAGKVQKKSKSKVTVKDKTEDCKFEDEFDVYMLKNLIDIVDTKDIPSGCVLDAVDQQYFFSDAFRNDILAMRAYRNLSDGVNKRCSKMRRYMEGLFGITEGFNIRWYSFLTRHQIYSEEDLGLDDFKIVELLKNKFPDVSERNIKFCCKNKSGEFYPKISKKNNSMDTEICTKLLGVNNINHARKYGYRLVYKGFDYFSK
jgi:predicted GIY-YIG superfamily endonuclease